MTTVFIAGSIKIKHLDRKFKERIDKIIASGFDVVVGDADGADTAIQTYLFEQGSSHTTVYCSGPRPRNNVGRWPIHSVTSDLAPGSRAYFTAKDLAMAEAADNPRHAGQRERTAGPQEKIGRVRQQSEGIHDGG